MSISKNQILVALETQQNVKILYIVKKTPEKKCAPKAQNPM